jgi:riboflavin kinase/FMN adenylyltransferase
MGDITFLQAYGKEHDILVEPVVLEYAERARISSTRIRTLLAEGKLAEANALLGHPFMVCGTVVKGDQRGRQLGYPTANLATDPHKLLPANGIYAVRAGVGRRPGTITEAVGVSDEGDSIPVYTGRDMENRAATQDRAFLRMLYRQEYNSAASVGIRPMFDGKTRLVEAYLLDANLDLYGQTIALDFIERLRDEERFASIEALKDQMAVDVQHVRQILQAYAE